VLINGASYEDRVGSVPSGGVHGLFAARSLDPQYLMGIWGPCNGNRRSLPGMKSSSAIDHHDAELHRVLTPLGFRGCNPQDHSFERGDGAELREAGGVRTGALCGTSVDSPGIPLGADLTAAMILADRLKPAPPLGTAGCEMAFDALHRDFGLASAAVANATDRTSGNSIVVLNCTIVSRTILGFPQPLHWRACRGCSG
jgi:hypothetical protein